MDSRSIFLMTFGLVIVAVGLTSGQLIGPFQACELRCQQEMGAYHQVDASVDVNEVCRQYCLKHAFDHIGETQQPPVGR